MSDHVPEENKVVNLGEYKEKRPEYVWECTCGDQLFYLVRDTGGFKCRTCGKMCWHAIGDTRDENNF